MPFRDGTPRQDCLIRAHAQDTERRYRMTVARRSTWRTERRLCRRPATERGVPNDRSGLGQISVRVTAHTTALRSEVAAGWQTFVAVSGSRFWLPARPVCRI